MSIYNNNRVSIITPVYNAEKYIGSAIDSILAQTYNDWEIVLVDDCSTDNSSAIIASYGNSERIKYHKRDINEGAAVARNTALKLATGRYVAFLDSDDIWKPLKLEKQLAFMKDKDAAISCTALECIDENGASLNSIRNVNYKISYNFLLHNTMIATSTVIVDRNKTGDFLMPLRRGGQDYATWLKLMKTGNICYGLNEVLSEYRVLKNSLSSNKIKSIKQVWQIQTVDEGINKVSAAFNVCCFVYNALKKNFKVKLLRH